jgi:hypothetical protein
MTHTNPTTCRVGLGQVCSNLKGFIHLLHIELVRWAMQFEKQNKPKKKKRELLNDTALVKQGSVHYLRMF